MKRKRIMIVLLTTVLLIMAILPWTATGNSAQSYWTGVSRTGMIVTDEESPIVVQHEQLTFDLQQFPEHHYSEANDYLAYTGSVTAEYTFHNPSDYTVTAKLLFPFGNIPDYGMLHDPQTNQPMYRTDSSKFGVSVNGETIEAVLRHSFAYPFDDFVLETDMARLSDGYVDDPFYNLDLPVTKYVFHAENIDHDAYRTATAAIELPFGEERTKYVMVENNGFELLDDGFRLSSFIGYQEADNIITFYVIGEHPEKLPEWKFYENGACEKEIDGMMILDETEELLFEDVAMSQYPTDTECSPEDWYNAIVTFMRMNEYADGFVGNDFTYGDGMFDVNRCLMRWYAYEITLEAGQRIINTVTAPMYPDIDGRYDTPVYAYRYLLSPAKTWTKFDSLEIVINTPFYMTENSLEGFEKTENGYLLSTNGLPEGELTFSLSSSDEPVSNAENGYIGSMILIYIGLFVLAAVVLTVIVLFIWCCIRNLSSKTRSLIILILVMAVAAAITLLLPKTKTALFVKLYHDDIENSISQSMGVPADDAVLFGYKYVNTWEGDHSMTEFLIGVSGFGSETTYYGCYYSPDDVPLAFQNLDTALVQNSDSWTWMGEGDNCGITTKIMDKWYYFEASF